GAGTSLSILQTMNEAYKVAQLRQQTLSAFKALFLATLGGARALGLDAAIGSFDPGKEADFVVLNPQATTVLRLRNSQPTAKTLAAVAEVAFSLMMLGCDRAISATYILGENQKR
ncbi:MAG: amidohydrolase family protein, partial [Cyanobacteria bacterium P01_H01_bin.153]